MKRPLIFLMYRTIILVIELKVASRYEATVAAQNEEDWSRHSPVYHFATFGAGKELAWDAIFI